MTLTSCNRVVGEWDTSNTVQPPMLQMQLATASAKKTDPPSSIQTLVVVAIARSETRESLIVTEFLTYLVPHLLCGFIHCWSADQAIFELTTRTLALQPQNYVRPSCNWKLHHGDIIHWTRNVRTNEYTSACMRMHSCHEVKSGHPPPNIGN